MSLPLISACRNFTEILRTTVLLRETVQFQSCW